MGGVLRAGIGFALCMGLATAPTGAQEAVRWLRDVGAEDEQVGEAAERRLVALGEQALRSLADELDNWDSSQAADRRNEALLRVIHLLGADAAPLYPKLRDLLTHSPRHRMQVFRTMADLRPFAIDATWLNQMWISRDLDPEHMKQNYISFALMYERAAIDDPSNGNLMTVILEDDTVGGREAAAEALGRLRYPGTVDLLRDRLLERGPAADVDQITHNGFVVPFEDRFPFRAAEVIIELAPDDDRSVIAYANRALHHPHRTVRKDALAKLASFGPLIAEALPELLEIAEGSDDELAVEALKLLGLTGKAVQPFAARVRALTTSRSELRARIAGSIVRRLEAMGVSVPEVTVVEPDADWLALRAAIAKWSDANDPALERRILADERSWDQLVLRLRNERERTPDAVLEMIMTLGWQRPEAERRRVRHSIALLGGMLWRCKGRSDVHTGRELATMHQRAYAWLTVDPKASLHDLVGFLSAKNAPVRLRATELLSARHREWAAGEPHHDEVRLALQAATTADVPKQSEFDIAEFHASVRPVDLADEIQAAARAALDRARRGAR